MNSGVTDKEVTRYLSWMDRLRYQGLIYFVKTISEPVNLTQEDLQTVEFRIKLSANQYVNLNSIHVCFTIKIKRKLKTLVQIWLRLKISLNAALGKLKQKKNGNDLQVARRSVVGFCWYFDVMILFSIRVFFYKHSWFKGQQRKGGGSLFNSSPPIPLASQTPRR